MTPVDGLMIFLGIIAFGILAFLFSIWAFIVLWGKIFGTPEENREELRKFLRSCR